MIARIEQKVGEKLPIVKTGNQEYWQIGNDKLVGAIVAIEGTHLVVHTCCPSNASDALKQALLGVTRPAQNIGAAGTLQALANQHHYSPYGEGFLDTADDSPNASAAAPGGHRSGISPKLLDLPIERQRRNL